MSETTNLKLKKHDNVETNTDKFDIENYLNGNFDKIDEHAGEVNTEISNIKKEQETQNTNIEENNSKIIELQTEKAKLEKELKEMQEDIYQNSIRGQASGEYIHVEDSSGARCKIGISGNSEQETNLYNGGLELGSINNTGEVSASNRVRTMKTIEVKENTKIKVSANGADEFLLVTYNSNKEFQNTTSWADLGTSVTIPTGIKYIRIVLRKKDNSSITSSNITNFVVGDTPSLDYPSPVKTVGSNVNIFDITKYDYRNLAGASVEINDKTNFRITATASNNANCAVGFKIMDLTKCAGKTLTIKAYAKSSTSTNKAFIALRQNNSVHTGTKSNELFDESQNTTDGIITLKYKVTDTVDDSNRYLFIFFYATRGAICNIGDYVDYKVKLVEGTEVGEYSKYGQGCVKVTKCNKNLSKYKTFTSTSSARVVGDTTASGQQIKGIKVRKGKKYTISFDVVGLPSNDYRIQIRESTDESVAQTNGEIPNSIQNEPLICNTLTRYSKTTTAQGDNYLYIKCIPNGFVLDNIQVEEKEISTSSEQHEEQSYIMPTQQPMRSIGDIRDTFIKKENKWYERHYVQRLILNGTEGWNYDKNNNRFYFAKAGNKGSGYIMSSHYLRGDTTKQNNTCEIWSSAILFRDERFTEREDFKNMIKAKYDEGIPVYVDYVSITPTDIECTEEQSQILDELTNARTYKNVTNITTDSKAILSLDYVKDLETLLTSKESEV